MAHIQCNFQSSALQKNVKVLVFIPTPSADDYLKGPARHYYKDGLKYQTLYLLHGSYGSCTDWVHFSNVERYAQEHCVALVMPDGENSFYRDLPNGEAYLTYIADELPRFMGTLFPLSEKREDTFIAGLSMGGYGAFLAALHYPGQFGAAAALSGVFDLDSPLIASSNHLLKMPDNYKRAVLYDATDPWKLSSLLAKAAAEHRVLPKFYSSCGLEDFVLPAAADFIKTAETRGIRIVTENFHGGHDWNYWDAHIQDVLKWLPLKGDLVNMNTISAL
jgi:S-formylglutathione hydrolase FrmB